MSTLPGNWRRWTRPFLFVAATCAWGLFAYDYWASRGQATTFYVIIGAGVFLAAVVAAPLVLHSAGHLD